MCILNGSCSTCDHAFDFKIYFRSHLSCFTDQFKCNRMNVSTFLFYNKDMLAEAGWEEFPKTMDELIQCIDDCTKVGADGSIEQMGLIPDYPWLDNVLWPVAFGAQFIDEETNTITFDSPEMLKAYQFQADIYSKYGYDNVKRFIDSLGARATTEDPLFTGKLAIRWQADSALASMVDAAKETGTNFMAEGDYGNGAFMPRKSALDAVIAMDGVSEEAKQVAEMLRDGEFRAFPMSSYVNEYLTEISTYMTEALAGNMTVEDAAKAVVEAVQPLADEAAG